MNVILVHPRTKEEAKLIVDLFEKMNISYEKNVKLSADDIPNATTRKALKDAREGKGESFNTLSELFGELKK